MTDEDTDTAQLARTLALLAAACFFGAGLAAYADLILTNWP